MNDTVVDILKNGSNKLVSHIFADHPGQSNVVDRDDVGKGKGKGKKVKPFVYFRLKLVREVQIISNLICCKFCHLKILFYLNEVQILVFANESSNMVSGQ